MDRISQLPENIILHHILPRLPIKGAGRTSILSKTWKSLCNTHISSSIILDHNTFALVELLRSANCEPTVHVIRDRFIDFAETQLVTMNQEKSGVLKLEIDVAVIDDDFSHVDKLMNLVRNTKVEELSIFIQTRDFKWWEEVYKEYECYDFPYFIFTKSWLRSLAIRWCKINGRSFPTDVDLLALGNFSSLRELHLNEVCLSDEASLDNLSSCCPRIEVINFVFCTFWLETLKLSKFPHLKKAYIDADYGFLSFVDLTETKLESFYCSVGVECTISLASCSNIRKIHLNDCIINEPHLFKDLATSFPLLEKAEIYTYLQGVDRIKASNYHLKTLKLLSNHPMKEIHIDGPNLENFNYVGSDVEELYVDCPKLRQLYYNGNNKIPTFRQEKLPNLDVMSLGMSVRHPIETSWFISLSKKFLEQRREYEVYLDFSICSRMPVNFKLEEFGAIWNSQHNIVHLVVQLLYRGNNNQFSGDFSGDLVDGLIWSIRPTTLTTCSDCDGFVKNLKEKLALKDQTESCCELGLCNKYWWHNIRNFRFRSYKNRTNLQCFEVVLDYFSGSSMNDDELMVATQLMEMHDSTSN